MKKNYEKILPTYICDIQEINNLSKVMFMNNFPHHQFILCTSGTGKICTENNIEQTVSKGDIVFINSSILFSLRQQENFSIKRIAFNGNFVTNYLQYFDFNPAVVFVPKSNEVFNAFNIAYDGYMHDKDDIQNIFKRFYKGKNSKSDSVGIGLAMAKSIIESQNGDIYVKSKKNRGSEFHITFHKRYN